MTITVCPLRAETGSKVRGVVRVDLGATVAEVPVTLVNGVSHGPRVVITGGVHGGEFVGIDPIPNPPAVYQGRLNRSPLDGININRVFPGGPAGSPTERMAAWLFENLIDGADAYADLHSGGIDETLSDFVGYRRTGDALLDEKARAMAHAVGYEDVIPRPEPDGGNSHAAAARRGIPAILIETGQLGERDEATVRRLLDGLYRLLHHLGVLDEPTATAAGNTREWTWV